MQVLLDVLRHLYRARGDSSRDLDLIRWVIDMGPGTAAIVQGAKHVRPNEGLGDGPADGVAITGSVPGLVVGQE